MNRNEIAAEKIKHLLKERNISCYKLSKKCNEMTGIATKSVYNAAKGKKNTSLYTLECISKGLDVSLEYLISTDEQCEYYLSDGEKRLIDIRRQTKEELHGRIEAYAEAMKDMSC